MTRLLFLTNGHGEDLAAAEIIKHLSGDFKISVLPLVGEGKAFENLKVKLLGARKKLPGGGFSLRNPWFLFQDLAAGLINGAMENIRILTGMRGEIDLTVAVGDLVPVIGALILKKPFLFVGVNKSDHYKWFGFRYTPWEKWLLKKYAEKIYVRDILTAENFYGAEYAGNLLMDCLEKYPVPRDKGQETIIGFLPGTREDAGLNIEDFEKVVEELVAGKDRDMKFRFMIATTLTEAPEYMERKPFAQVLAEADLIVGLSGTGNEQAAGCGVPVVSFYGRGSQYNKKFARAQKQLLGDALCLIPSVSADTAAAAILQIIKDPALREKMGEAGRERMGEGGAAKKIAEYIHAFKI